MVSVPTAVAADPGAEGGVKIGVITHAYYPHFGGVTENVAGSAQALRTLGHRVTIVTAGPQNGRRPEQVIRLGGQCMVPWNGASVNFTYGAHLKKQLQTLYRQQDFDLVHVHCPLAPMLPLSAVRAAAAAGVPVVGTFHATASWNIGYHIFRRALRRDFDRLDRKLAVSQPARAFVSRYFPGSYQLIPNGVDLDRFSPHLRVGPVALDRPTILCAGRLDPRKGVEHLIDAVALVARTIPAIRLRVIGDGPRRRRLEARARRVAPQQVEFLGSVSPAELPDHFAAADLVCCPATHNESFGIVILEAMAAARPVVASDISGYRLVVKDGVTGRLVPPGAAPELATALAELLRDPARARRLGQAGRQLAYDYSWQAVGKKLQEVYQQLTGQTATPQPTEPRPLVESI